MLTNTTIVGNGGASSLGGGIANAGADLDADQRHIVGQHSRLDPDRPGRRRRASRTQSSAPASPTAATGDCVAVGKVDPRSSPTGRSSTRSPTTRGITSTRTGPAASTATSDIANVDPHLASIADNGGPTRTQALLAGSQAIDSGNPAHCLANRPARLRPRRPVRHRRVRGPPDLRALRHRAPARRGPITDSSADLHGTINLSGDAGGFHFVWGLSQDDLLNSTPGPRRRHRRKRHLRDPDALGPESRDHVLLQDRRRQLVRLHAGHRFGHQELHDAGGPTVRVQRQCRLGHRHDRQPLVHDQPRTAPTPAMSSSTATQIRATI